MCINQIEWGLKNRGTDNDSYFDKLWFGKPHCCYETHSVFKGRVKRSLDHSFKTVPGTIRHCWQTNATVSVQQGRLAQTVCAQWCSSPLFRDLKFPMNLTYSYTGGSLGSMVPRSMWQQNSSWFFAKTKKQSMKTGEEDVDLGWIMTRWNDRNKRLIYFSDIQASVSPLPWYERTEPCTRLNARPQARSSTGSGLQDQTETSKMSLSETRKWLRSGCFSMCEYC